MFKYIMLVALVGLVGCHTVADDRELTAFKAGCVHGITVVVEQMGAQANKEKIEEHCADEAVLYQAGKEVK